MRIKPNNLNPVMNTLAIEQAARKAAQEKADESAKARQAEESLRLQQLEEALKRKKEGQKKNPDGFQGRRTTRYLKDGTVQTEGPENPDDTTSPPPQSGIDIKV
jgi:hypothetical protein